MKNDTIIKSYLKILNESSDENEQQKKAYLIEYTSGGRTYKNIVESDDIESYIKKNFGFEISVLKKLDKKTFYQAEEVENINGRWHLKPHGERWYCKMISLSDRQLMKGTRSDFTTILPLTIKKKK